MRRRALTLVEALVILTVLIVAVVILMPTGCGGARENRRRSHCQSKLKQLGLGIIQYSSQYDMDLPHLDSPGESFAATPFRSGPYWVNAVYPWIKDPQVFQCPSEPNSVETDYYLNQFVAGRRIEHIVHPTKVVLLVEGVDTDASTRAVATGPQSTGANPAPYARHLDGSNYAFVDGHVKWLGSTLRPTVKDLSGGFTFAGKVVKVKP